MPTYFNTCISFIALFRKHIIADKDSSLQGQ